MDTPELIIYRWLRHASSGRRRGDVDARSTRTHVLAIVSSSASASRAMTHVGMWTSWAIWCVFVAHLYASGAAVPTLSTRYLMAFLCFNGSLAVWQSVETAREQS